MIKHRLTPRSYHILAFMGALAFLLFAYYLQDITGLIPCPLCSVQRMILIALCGLLILGVLLPVNAVTKILIDGLGFITSCGGVLFAGRQVWLQHFPPLGAGDCGVSLEYMYEILPLKEFLSQLWMGGTECAHYTWAFLHLSLAEWSTVMFGCFIIFFIWMLKPATRR